MIFIWLYIPLEHSKRVFQDDLVPNILPGHSKAAKLIGYKGRIREIFKRECLREFNLPTDIPGEV